MRLMPRMGRGAVPELVRVMDCAWETVPDLTVPNARLVVLSLTEGAVVPVPARVTFCGEPKALSEKFSVAVAAEAVNGWKAT